MAKEKAFANKRERRIKEEVKHTYIPVHEIISDPELEELKQRININKIPTILITDEAIKHLDVRPGDIIKIRRINPGIGETFYYRKVIKSIS